jgi:drug/metabolite transporter (DMT)-like permease
MYFYLLNSFSLNSISDKKKGIFFALFTTLLWGFLPIVLKVSLAELPPVLVTWFRFFLASLLLIIYYVIRKPSEFRIMIRPPSLLILASISLGLNYLGFISGVHYTTPAIAEIFIQTGAILLAISGFVFFREKASFRQIIGIVMVFSGLVVFYRDQILLLADNIDRYQKGVLLTLGGGIMWTSYAILQKRLVRDYDPMLLNLVLFTLPAIAYIPFVDFRAFQGLTPAMWGVLIFLGVNTLLAYGSLGYALKYLEANKVSVIITLNPIITFSAMAILMALEVSWIVHENFTFVSIAGASLVISGAVFTVLKRRKRKQ